MNKNRLFLGISIVSLLLMSLAAFNPFSRNYSVGKEAANDFYQRHPDWIWTAHHQNAAIPISGNEAFPDYSQRHPELSSLERLGHGASDYFERHPELIRTSIPVVDTSNYFFQQSHAQPQQATMTTFYQGLTNPRGLKFGPDGYLYVAEGGPATNTWQTTINQCQQVPGPIGPYFGGNTSRISKISPDGSQRTTVIDKLPSSQTQPPMNFVSGVADVAFINNTLYGIEAGAGCSHGLIGTNNTVFRVNPDGSTTTIADLSQYQKANPVAHPEEDDFEPDGTWYSLLSMGSTLYAVEPNHGELDRILLNGQIQRVVDISASEGHIVPTAFTFHNGDFYVGNLNTFPVDPGSSQIMKINNGGRVMSVIHGLSTVLGVAFDAHGRMYALESVPNDHFPAPNTFVPGSGRVVRVNDDGTLTTITSGLDFPTGLTFGPDGALYVSNVGFGVNVEGSGEIMRITIND